MCKKAWTDGEIDYLKRNYLKMTNNELANQLGRTRGAVKTKLNKDLKLQRPTQTLTNEEFIHKITSLVGGEYSFLEPYISSRTSIKVVHNCCQHVYSVKPNNFIFGHTRCPKCYGNSLKTTDKFIEELYSLVGNEYNLIGEYRGNDKPVEILHKVCGNIYEIQPRVFTSNGCRCSLCNGGVPKSQEQFDNEVQKLVGDEYVFLQDYINNNTNIKIKHMKCDYTYSVRPSNFLSGRRCPKCSSSRGERKIYDFLKNNYNDKLNIIPQARYLGLHYNNSKEHLRSDFKVSNINDDVSFFIEYDGIQHFAQVNWSGKMTEAEMEYNLKHQLAKDKLKNIHCRDNNIKLLRIPYWNFDNIENILIDFIKKEKIL